MAVFRSHVHLISINSVGNILRDMLINPMIMVAGNMSDFANLIKVVTLLVDQGEHTFNLLPAETMATTMLVEVDELCTKTVTRTPIISPIIGLFRILLLANTYTGRNVILPEILGLR